MQIDKKLLAEWKILHTHGDGKKICDQNPDMYPIQITRALKGKCNDRVFLAIRDYYQNKKILMSDNRTDYRTEKLLGLLPDGNGMVLTGIRSWIEQGKSFEEIRKELKGMSNGHSEEFKKIIGQEAFDFVFSD